MNEQNIDRVNKQRMVKGMKLERCEEKETCNITCRPRQHNPTVRPNTVLLRICGLNLHHTIKIKYHSQKEAKYTF